MVVAAQATERGARRARCAVLFALVLLSCQYFFTGGGKNQASRFDLVRAIVDSGTLRIDAYHANTGGDEAFFEGHYYCDKAPGVSLLAVPFVAAARRVSWSGRAPPAAPPDERELLLEARVATFFGASLPTAVTAVLLYLTALRWGCSSAASLAGAGAFALGTPAWAYATLFWGHALAGACLFGAFALAVDVAEAPMGRATVLAAAFGLAAGWAVVAEYTAGGAVALLVALVLGRERRRGGRRIAQIAAGIAAGAAVPAAILATYDRLAFGSMTHLGYSSVVGWQGMRRGLFGITYPKLDVLLWLLVGRQKGLLLLSPVLLAAPFGLGAWMRDERRRLSAAVSAAVFLYYLLVNASYTYWSGGWTYGPRFLGAGLPFLCLGLAPLRDRGRTARRFVDAGLVASVALTFVAMATNPMTPEQGVWPLRDVLLPSFLHGRLSLNHARYFFADRPTPSFNWGEAAGLRGLASLAPLAVVWGAAAAAWAAIGRRVARERAA